MWKITALSALALLAALGSTVGGAIAQPPPPRERTAQPRAATPAPPAAQPAKSASPRKRTRRHASRHHKRRHAASFKCFAHEWRAFPTRDRNGYFYTPPGGGVC
jgi:hypothetical protein